MNLIVYFFIGVGIAIILLIILLRGKASAKKTARQLLAKGKIEDFHELKRTMDLLANANDVESKYLWGKLQALNEQQSADK